jgi:hypothetical protein
MHYRNVNRSKVRVLELFLISKTLYEPIVDVGSGQGRLSGFQ